MRRFAPGFELYSVRSLLARDFEGTLEALAQARLPRGRGLGPVRAHARRGAPLLRRARPRGAVLAHLPRSRERRRPRRGHRAGGGARRALPGRRHGQGARVVRAEGRHAARRPAGRRLPRHRRVPGPRRRALPRGRPPLRVPQPPRRAARRRAGAERPRAAARRDRSGARRLRARPRAGPSPAAPTRARCSRSIPGASRSATRRT